MRIIRFFFELKIIYQTLSFFLKLKLFFIPDWGIGSRVSNDPEAFRSFRKATKNTKNSKNWENREIEEFHSNHENRSRLGLESTTQSVIIFSTNRLAIQSYRKPCFRHDFSLIENRWFETNQNGKLNL